MSEASSNPPKISSQSSEEELIAAIRWLGENRFADRSAEHDRDAKFPTENYEDLRDSGFLALTIPAEFGGIGASFATYCRVSAEMGRWCGATALTFNMHAQTTLWTGQVFDTLPGFDEERTAQNERRKKLYEGVLENGHIFAQPFSEPNSAAAAGKAPFGTTARKVDGGWIVNGTKHFASLSGAAKYYSMVCTVESDEGKDRIEKAVYLCVPEEAEGFEIFGPWDPVGMRATVSRGLKMNDVFVPDDLQLLPAGAYYQLALNWPHMFFTLSPTYLGISQAAFDFTVQYLSGGMRDIPAKQHAVGEMRLKLEQSRALFETTIADAGFAPTKDQRMRAYAAQYTIMEHAQDICALAMRTCGGRTLLKSMPLERLYRESRCGALMLPWTAEIAHNRLAVESLYEPSEDRRPR